MAISRMVEKLSNDKVGLIVFAGDAYVQLPITTDYSSAKLFLSNINTDMMPVQGTSIGAAIDLAARFVHAGNGRFESDYRDYRRGKSPGRCRGCR